MKQLYILLFLFVSSKSISQIITIPDANFKAKLLSANTLNLVASSTVNSFSAMVIDANNNGEIEVSEALLVKWLDVSNSSIDNLDGISDFINLKKLMCSYNNLITLNINSLQNLNILNCSHNLLTSLENNQIITGFELLNCSFNNLTSLTVPGPIEYTDETEPSITLYCGNNQLSQIIFNTYNLNRVFTSVDLSNNNFTTLIFPYISIQGGLNISNNPLVNLDLSEVSLSSGQSDYSYGTLYLNNTLLEHITIPFDISTSSQISNNPNLFSLNIKNNQSNLECYEEYDDNGNEIGYVCQGIELNNNPQLTLVCCDPNEVLFYTENSPSGVQVSEYCNFTPGGEFKTLTGNVRLDINNDGCDNNDISSVDLPIEVRTSNGFFIGSTSTNNLGNYTYYIPNQTSVSYNRVFTPYFQNPYYTISPENFVYNYTTASDIETANFCISPNGIHPDLEVSILPISPARPGFDATYKLTFKNKGTETQSGTVGFTFMDTVLDLASSNPIVSLQVENTLSWDFIDLLPFETREITVVLNVN